MIFMLLLGFLSLPALYLHLSPDGLEDRQGSSRGEAPPASPGDRPIQVSSLLHPQRAVEWMCPPVALPPCADARGLEGGRVCGCLPWALTPVSSSGANSFRHRAFLTLCVYIGVFF